MKKFFKASIITALSFVLVAPSLTTPASAKSKVKVISTSKVAHKTYHGKHGNIYSSAKLTHRKYKMSKYRYTTWTATKKAVIKNHGKKATLAYIKSGKKAGWIYKKYLTAGKAPFNKQKRLYSTYSAYMKALMQASADQQYYKPNRDDGYEGMADSISSNYGEAWYGSDAQKDAMKDKNALVKIYGVFKNRFSGSQRSDMDAMAKELDNMQVTADNLDQVDSNMKTFAQTLSTAVGDLS
ncbi:hypothetical protein [Levilactobacillus suantsaiihabitans]|uniref:Surface layer protein A domain-containing protein n=1 Tax=Levilactobacillus suantsaiihabitans TaxID=2487722 RepID=A0A4Z0J9W3_9LACO|nr:hypothetical protein [Levilactobacillus suantsaiihabitans]TGD19541.1 hypothetical protein EGT51_03290 [Levilactobacillus suantsaiihabitans]